jgi:hypothetical protein
MRYAMAEVREIDAEEITRVVRELFVIHSGNEGGGGGM